MIENNKGMVKVVIKNFPLPMHSHARKAAEAALAAYKMGKFREYEKELFENSRWLSDEKLLDIATSLGLDRDEFEKEMNSKEVKSKIDHDIVEGEKAGVAGTPTIFINGQKLRDRSVDGFQNIINDILNRKR